MKIELSHEELGHILECVRSQVNDGVYKDMRCAIIDKIKQFLIDNEGCQ